MPRAVKKTRFEARIAPDALKMIRRAAEIEGRSVSDFVISAAYEAAEKKIERSTIIRLAMEDQLRFFETIANPPEPGPALYRARDAHRRLVRRSK